MAIEFDPKAHGAVPFWFWNGDQQESEISRQVELAAEAGLRGMAIHARTGNRTDYMSERWIALTRHTCDEALRLGLDIWLYDEEGFPSGTVGNRLQKDQPFYQQKQLHFEYVSGAELSTREHVVAVFDATTYEKVALHELESDQEVLAFRINYLSRYVDTLKRETADRFMAMTHDKYLAELGEYFGNPITHVYTDDLNSNLSRGPALPYTENLFEIFAERFGYDLMEHLPKLVENLPGCEPVRLDFRKLLMDLFLDEFVAPMHRWCEDHGLLFTGHLSGDEGPFDKSATRFGSAMAFYEHEHIPGIDDFLCSVPSGRYLDSLRNHRGHSATVLLKQATSVANQLKAGICGGEVLTFLGWDAPVWGQAALLNFELAMGVNVFTHHDFSYATGGVAKRDCPPSYFFQQPYWEAYKLLLDGLARSSQLLKRGRYAASVLVLHPMSSCWIAMDGKQITIAEPFETRTPLHLPDPIELEDSLAAISQELIKKRVGFDYGDEWLMAKHATVEKGRIRVGAMVYDTVIIPKVSNLLQSTVDLLSEMEASGGRLLAIDPPAECLVDGNTPSHRVFGDQLTPGVLETSELLIDAGLATELDLGLEPGTPVASHARLVDDHTEAYVFNVSDEPHTIRWCENLIAYDPVENQCLATDDGPQLTLPPFHGIHLLPEPPAGARQVPAIRSVFALAHTQLTPIPKTAWRTTLDQPNLFLVDWCDLPDGRSVYHTDTADSAAGTLSVTIEVPDPGAITGILGETVTLDTIRVNGTPIPTATAPHPSSQDMMITDATGLFQSGHNVIEFSRLDGAVLFEPFYLMGDFGVELVETDRGMRPKMMGLSLGFGDLVAQGLPFYWGRVTYEAELDLSANMQWLNVESVDGVLALSVNGERVGCRYMPPYRFNIGDAITEGANTICLTLSNTAQNLYGPHRREYGVALTPCKRRGETEGAYFLAGFGVDAPVSLL